MSLSPGQKLGPYEIIELAGAGGMGDVFKAKDTRLDRTVAIKVLSSEIASNPDLKERFEREAKAISSLNHPNICILYDVGSESGTDYLVMEYLEGDTLSERLKQGPLGVDELIRIAIQIAEALDKAHRQGLVHRDLKPGNVMLTKDGAKLLDFGLAKLQAGGGVIDGDSGITQTTPLTGAGTILGTVPYMAPEQLEGREADARSDIFAFGALLYEMATGKRAFEGSSQASLIASILKEEPRSVSELQPMSPPMLERIIKQCLAKDPDNRWQTAGDLKRSLLWISEGDSQIGIPIPVSAKRKLREHLLWGAGIFLLGATVLFATLYWQKISEPVRVVRSTILAPDAHEFLDVVGGHFAISPDGTKLAVSVVDTIGAFESASLWVRDLNSMEAIPIPNTEPGAFPFWSPDSRYIGYSTETKLMKVLATGGPPIPLCDVLGGGRGASWGANDIILFTPSERGDVIHSVPAAGGQSKPVTVLDSAFSDHGHRWAHFLPDGNHFLFLAITESSAGGEQDAICLGALDSPEVIRLANAKSSMAYANGQLLFVHDGVLIAQPFDVDALELTGEAIPIAENVSYFKDWSRGMFSVSTNGHLVYRPGRVTTSSQLIIVDSTGRQVDSIGEPVEQYSARVSPDGRKVAVDILDASSSNTDIWIHDLDRKTRTRFTFEAANDLGPIWSPDGNYIAYQSTHNDGYGLFVKSVSGVDLARLVYSSEYRIWPESWSADGKYLGISPGIVIGFDIWVVPLDTSLEPFAYLSSLFGECEPAISPNGRWMAYASKESGKEEVYVSPFPNPTGKWQVSINEGDRPRWSNDGQRLYYLDNAGNIMVAQVEGAGSSFSVGKVTQMFRIRGFKPGSVYDLFPDNKRFLVNSIVGSRLNSRLTLVQNWVEEID